MLYHRFHWLHLHHSLAATSSFHWGRVAMLEIAGYRLKKKKKSYFVINIKSPKALIIIKNALWVNWKVYDNSHLFLFFNYNLKLVLQINFIL